ncbi:jg23917 [Pararge aegeria aegeria]|uniref:Jg23917 protein n=1 Tax=Pararge aegeria aegeria TaxID=348720 RepID=A0A8S4S840_9NEOP|nr:jg23917 [Pararge aegeria aegeria]
MLGRINTKRYLTMLEQIVAHVPRLKEHNVYRFSQLCRAMHPMPLQIHDSLSYVVDSSSSYNLFIPDLYTEGTNNEEIFYEIQFMSGMFIFSRGILYQKQKRYGEAIKSFESAIHFRPSLALAYVNLGTSLMEDGRLAEAVSALRAGSRADGQFVRDRREHDNARVSALVQLASLHSQKGHWHKALSAYKEALQILPDTNAPIVGWTRHNVLSMASVIHMQLNQWPQAEYHIQSALALNPGHAETHVSLAKIVARNASRSMEAELWFRKAITLTPDDPSIRDQFGEFLRSQGRLRESAEQFVYAARLSPTDSVRAASAALALRAANRGRAAERWYARAAELDPYNAAYHSNLGAILHQNEKYKEAATSYYRALQLKPNDEITIINIKRVRAAMSKANGKSNVS